MEELINLKDKFYNDILPNGRVETTESFLQNVFNLMLEFIKKSSDHSEKVLNFHHPNVLDGLIEFKIDDEPNNLDFLISICKSIMENVVKTGHPRFFNQLYQGLDLISLAAAWITSTTNTNLHTYEVCPVYVLMEKYTLQKMIEIVGWDEPADGIFCPGGSISNLYSIQAARHFYFPQTKFEGLFNIPKLIIFTSTHAHYSVARNAAILGIGINQVRKVPVDQRGKLIPSLLESMIISCIEQKEVPILVSLTSGTTVLGAFDPIRPVADICEKYKIWLHVDAAWGGGAILSRKHRYKLDGIERAHSITLNPHKMMGAILQCSSFLIRKTGLLKEVNKMCADYLFQQDKLYDTSFDVGDKTIQCGRHVDIFKIWLLWKAKGSCGFEKTIDHFFSLAEYFYQEIQKRSNFEIVLENPEFTNICFWYIPESLQLTDKESVDYKQKLNLIAPKIKAQMILDGSMMISFQPQDSKPNFFRIIFCNPATNIKDLDFVLDEIHRLGKDL